ncbi:hypothetical protein [Legionella sp. km772]|uniref:hypothetical protein n=1 Tax=Legionella sp. km772 TaxID=2498111 RepID=UPI000F8EB2F0|nr:hypothetical protein [Legionella sp. km772]RUR08911.1 hypothetical protein ELY15_09915 [Legionella sp. km772]
MRTLVIHALCLLLSLPAFANSSNSFRCEAMLPQEFQVPSLKYCNQKIVYIPASVEDKYNSPYFDVYMTDQVLKNNNMGAMVVNLPNKQKKIVYRSASLAGSPFCLNELVSKRQVNTIVNLIARPIAHAQFLQALEEDEFRSIGGASYFHVLNYGVTPDTIVNAQFFQLITTIIKQILHTKGDVLIHCVSGEHDTGIIFAILQKCYNKIPVDIIKKSTLCHIGPQVYSYQKASYNILSQVIDEYPCSLLTE